MLSLGALLAIVLEAYKNILQPCLDTEFAWEGSLVLHNLPKGRLCHPNQKIFAEKQYALPHIQTPISQPAHVESLVFSPNNCISMGLKRQGLRFIGLPNIWSPGFLLGPISPSVGPVP